jgi:hypothetical protein
VQQNIVDVVYKLGEDILYSFKKLGLNNADTQMGAIEFHGDCVIRASENIASAISELADAIRENGS